ncbi:hypothetical protein CCO02nite_24500 [Cellulomonas composti]|uniref:Uncharacterized protein n=1 Tax=Cellulomonas composti TaxID=266130 RepID=A0A511JCT8_9CELL|nr:hypothetical protein [Cellulomonas composti]GEL95792.1 hypothetical protein CCO02nite_24500 [Cellulomonas composti]
MRVADDRPHAHLRLDHAADRRGAAHERRSVAARGLPRDVAPVKPCSHRTRPRERRQVRGVLRARPRGMSAHDRCDPDREQRRDEQHREQQHAA